MHLIFEPGTHCIPLAVYCVICRVRPTNSKFRVSCGNLAHKKEKGLHLQTLVHKRLFGIRLSSRTALVSHSPGKLVHRKSFLHGSYFESPPTRIKQKTPRDRISTIKQILLTAIQQKSTDIFVRAPFHTPCPARYSVLHLLDVVTGGKAS